MSDSQYATHSPRFELLTRVNYDTWRIQVEALLVKNDSWDYVSGASPAPSLGGDDAAARNTAEASHKAWVIKDRKTKSDLILSISPSELKEIKNCITSHDVWTKLEATYASKTPARKASLYRQLTQQKMAEDDSMVDHLNSFFDATDKLKSTGANLDDDLLAIMLLHSLPASYENFRCAIESRDILPDLEILKIKVLEEFRSRHRTIARQMAQPPGRRRSTSDHRSRSLIKSADSARKRDTRRHKKCQEEAKSETSGLSFFTSATTNEKWCLDSGSTSHICGDESKFKNISRASGCLQLASDATATIRAKGDVNTSDNALRNITLKDTLYVPNVRSNLVSVAKVVDAGFNVNFGKRQALIVDYSGSIQARAERIGDLYFMKEADESHQVASFAKPKISLGEWHVRLGHLNYKDLKTMFQKRYVEGTDTVQIEDIGNCSTCVAAKMTREPFQSRSQYAKNPLEVIHTDVCGPMRTTSNDGARWFVTFIDEHTRFCHVYPMKEKSQVVEKFLEYKNLVENQTGHFIKELQSDGGKEYDNNRLDELLKDAGIKRRFMVPHTPQQNGIAERKNRTLVETARCLLIQSGLPRCFWAEAIVTANYIRNRCYTETVGCTPYEKWTGHKPNISHMRSFGEKVHALDKNPKKGKFDRRGLEGVFLGYSYDSKAFRIWLTGAKKVICSRDVRFSNEFEKPSSTHKSPYDEENIVDKCKRDIYALIQNKDNADYLKIVSWISLWISYVESMLIGDGFYVEIAWKQRRKYIDSTRTVYRFHESSLGDKGACEHACNYDELRASSLGSGQQQKAVLYSWCGSQSQRNHLKNVRHQCLNTIHYEKIHHIVIHLDVILQQRLARATVEYLRKECLNLGITYVYALSQVWQRCVQIPRLLILPRRSSDQRRYGA
ncbi:unnamed protein product [Trichogramma brassicae]|uniref:Integrase catalytic domain-containing protein n=1 Tax=Trichogramma brassicae TaxID=86971 RepID=A0A6H5IEN4_9HYME|nr:unnamed protein product [Trichogramma brassicae]